MLSKVFTGHSFRGAVRYVHNDQSRAVVLAAEGVRGHDYRLMTQDFELQHSLRPSKKQACFHSILSFYPGENPGNKIMVEIAKKYLEGIGITNTQYAITKHTDKAHLHMHIIANMVNNDGNSIKDSWIGYRGKKVARQLTQEYNLVPALEKGWKNASGSTQPVRSKQIQSVPGYYRKPAWVPEHGRTGIPTDKIGDRNAVQV